jgi:type 1 glutamine amidotransferase
MTLRTMTRRMFILGSIAAGLLGASFTTSAAAAEKPRVLFLTKSQGFQHSVVARNKDNPTKLAHAEQVLTDMGAQHGFEVTVTKDADVFNNPETYNKYDVFAFYTTGDLTKDSDKSAGKGADAKLLHTEKGMSKEGLQLFLKAIENGKGYIGFHCASDTFHSQDKELVRDANAPKGITPYISLVGGEFAWHGAQQKATMKVASKTFPGLEDLQDFSMTEEWYNLINLAPDMHVILVQETADMPQKGDPSKKFQNYARPPFPATWARNQGKGRVFYTSMGHREDVWTNPTFQKVVVAGINWAAGKTKADVSPNLSKVAPQATTAAR